MKLKSIVRTLLLNIASLLNIDIKPNLVDEIHKIDDSEDTIVILRTDSDNRDMIEEIRDKIYLQYTKRYNTEPKSLFIFASKNTPLIEQMNKEELREKIKPILEE